MNLLLKTYLEGVNEYKASDCLVVNKTFLKNLKDNFYYFGYIDLHKEVKSFLDDIKVLL